MSAIAKPFQAATVRAAVKALRDPGGSRRFLIADEVGLGKTLVARDVMAALAKNRRTLNVFYVTSGSKVGDQNKRDLLAFLDEPTAAAALSPADRLGLIPFVEPLRCNVRLYAFSPETSFPTGKGSGSPGRAVERAFVSLLLNACHPQIAASLRRHYFRLNAHKSWPSATARARQAMANISEKFLSEYRKALRAEFAPASVAAGISDPNIKPRAVISRLRSALAEASLATNAPDLIILDEFQCYRGLLSPETSDRLAGRLFGAEGNAVDRPAVLLLSATPYRSYAERWELDGQSQPHREFFDVVRFLGGQQVGQSVADGFTRFGQILHALGRLPKGVDNTEMMQRGRLCKIELETLLRPYMSRTERLTRDQGSEHGASERKVTLTGTDLDIYRHFAERVQPRLRSSAMAYWLSVPLPAQALGASYQISRGVQFGAPRGLPRVATNRLYSPGKDGWGSAKLRHLHDIVSPDSLALPWVAPSIPWWPLSGPWGDGGVAKLLIFSRFRATPPAIAALTSLEVERRLLGRAAESYSKAWKLRRLQPKRGQTPTVALFHPSPFLIDAVDILQDGSRSSARQVRSSARRQLTRALRGLGIAVGGNNARDRSRHRPGWEVIAALEKVSGHSATVNRAWRALGQRDAALNQLLKKWAVARPLGFVSRDELEDLVSMAVAGPAVALGRALRRHYPEVTGAGLPALTRLCWTGLRRYFDNPVFWARLGTGSPTEALQKAVLEGGFEAVMDEHFWMRAGKKAGPALADDLLDALAAQVGWFTFRSLQDHEGGVRVRCHAAVPFGGTEGERSDDPSDDRPHRSEGIRAAFNTPFWPHVLATTSVGQEGLDFHTWCYRIGHWDLCTSPVDLEQREGRIQRFGGLVVRQRLGDDLGEAALREIGGGRSPWTIIGNAAEERFGDDTGLSPWWTLPNASIERHLFALPQSRDVHRFDRLCRQRSLYRLALGQPRQEELVELLGAKDPRVIGELAELTLDLSAYGADRSSLPIAAE